MRYAPDHPRRHEQDRQRGVSTGQGPGRHDFQWDDPNHVALFDDHAQRYVVYRRRALTADDLTRIRDQATAVLMAQIKANPGAAFVFSARQANNPAAHRVSENRCDQ